MALIRVASRVLSLVLLSTFLSLTNAGGNGAREVVYCIDDTNTFLNVFVGHYSGPEFDLPTNTLAVSLDGIPTSYAATRVFQAPSPADTIGGPFGVCPNELCPAFRCNSMGLAVAFACDGMENWVQFSIPICDVGNNPAIELLGPSDGSLDLQGYSCALFPSGAATLDTSTCSTYPTDQTSGYNTIHTFSLPAFTSPVTTPGIAPLAVPPAGMTSAAAAANPAAQFGSRNATGARAEDGMFSFGPRAAGSEDDYYVLELPEVKAGTKVTCSMTCNQDSYGGTSPALADAETFVMYGVFSDSVNPSNSIVYNRGVGDATFYNSCEAGISVVTNQNSKFFLIIGEASLGLTDARVVCKQDTSNCLGYVETARKYIRNFLG